jgi:predicted aspartyl protease
VVDDSPADAEPSRRAQDEVVFAEKGDLPLLGARSLEGLNLTVDPKRKKLVAAGPLLAASVGA